MSSGCAMCVVETKERWRSRFSPLGLLAYPLEGILQSTNHCGIFEMEKKKRPIASKRCDRSDR